MINLMTIMFFETFSEQFSFSDLVHLFSVVLASMVMSLHFAPYILVVLLFGRDKTIYIRADT